MKNYLFILFLLFSFTQISAQEKEEDTIYEIPEGQLVKFHQDDADTKIYFFNPVDFDKASLVYFRYLALKDPRVITVQKNKGTQVLSIQITNDFEFERFKNHIIVIKKEINYLLTNYDDHAIEIERLIYEGG